MGEGEGFFLSWKTHADGLEIVVLLRNWRGAEGSVVGAGAGRVEGAWLKRD